MSAGTLTKKETTEVGGEVGGHEGKGKINSGWTYEESREKKELSYAGWAKYKLCPDCNGGVTVKFLSSGGDSVGDSEGDWRYFHPIKGTDHFATKLSHEIKKQCVILSVFGFLF